MSYRTSLESAGVASAKKLMRVPCCYNRAEEIKNYRISVTSKSTILMPKNVRTGEVVYTSSTDTREQYCEHMCPSFIIKLKWAEHAVHFFPTTPRSLCQIKAVQTGL
jgi:hypothetical protein